MESNELSPESFEGRKSPGIASRVWMVFAEPSKLFSFLIRKTDWLIPLIIIAILGGAMNYIIRPIQARDMRPVAMQNIERFRQQMGERQFNEVKERIDRAFAEAESNPFKWYYPLIYFAYPFVFFAIISVIGLVAGNFLFGGKNNFWIVMNVVGYAALIGLLGDLARGALIIAKDTINVYTGMGLLKPIDDGSFIFYLFRQIDFFSIWRIAITALGLGIIYNMKPKKFLYVLFTVWLIFILIVSVINMVAGGTIVY